MKTKILIMVGLLGLWTGCSSTPPGARSDGDPVTGPGSPPSGIRSGILALDGKPAAEVVAELAAIKAARPEQTVEAFTDELDAVYQIQCIETCKITERTSK